MDVGAIKAAIVGVGFIFASLFGVSQNPATSTPVTQVATLPAAQNSGNSANWAGYVSQGGTYTSVSGTWIVPTVSDPSSNGADATWVGIGGVVSRDLIQAGTEALPDTNGNLTYGAWYELLPGISKQIPLAIAPGDSVTVVLTQVSAGNWVIDFRNNTTGHTYEVSAAYNSSLSSAEWIEELPIALDSPIVLDNFGVVNFTGGATIEGGRALSLSGAGASALSMTNAAHELVATPSVLGASGSSFSITRNSAAASALTLSRVGRVRPTVAAETSSSSGIPQQVVVRRFGHRGSWRVVFIRF